MSPRLSIRILLLAGLSGLACGCTGEDCSDISSEGLKCSNSGVCRDRVCVADTENALWPVPPEAPIDYEVADEVVRDRVTGLLWQRLPAPAVLVPSDAMAYCKGLSLGGHSSGWRLPSLIELLTLVDSSATASPTINGNVFPNTTAGPFWSASSVILNGPGWGDRWAVDFGTGGNHREFSSAKHAVRCVWSEPAAPLPRYSLGAETVRDERTGLVWERTPPATNVAWAEADAYCQALAIEGGGWRLPHKKELESLQDRRNQEQVLDPLFGTMDANSVYWTATPCAHDSGSWTIGFAQGAEWCVSGETLTYVRCVR